MVVVIKELHSQIETVQHNLDLATQAGLPYESYLHRARLADLLDMATRYGVDVSGWVDHSLLPLTLTDGEPLQ